MTDGSIDETAERLERRMLPAALVSSELRVSFEFFPPSGPVGAEALESSARALGVFVPGFVSVTYGAGGSSREKTFAALERLQAVPSLPLAGHLTCIASSKAIVDGVIDRYRAMGLRHIVALRGDTPTNGHAANDHVDRPSAADSYTTAVELVEAIRNRADSSEIEVSVAAYPEVHPQAVSAKADLDNLKRKVTAGADRVITQFCFDTDACLRFLDRARAAQINVPIVPGIMPINDFAGVCRFAERCGASVPEWLHERFAGLDETPEIRQLVAAAVAAEQCRRLAEHGVTDFHFYTMNKPLLSAAVCRILGIARSRSASQHRALACQTPQSRVS